jgi:hypothetical protein
MTAEELLKAGHLSAAVEQLNQEVRSRPSDIQRRTFLFELLCFTGDCQRAQRQLDVLGHQSATAEIGVQVYRHILTAEQARQRLFSEGVQPNFLFPPPSYVHLHLEALQQLCNPQPAGAVALLDQSQRSQPPGQGSSRDSPSLSGVMATICWRHFLKLLFTISMSGSHLSRLSVCISRLRSGYAICSGSLQRSKRMLAQWGRCSSRCSTLIRTGMLMGASSWAE